MINLIDLTTKLISIPSWVDQNNNESAIGEFIYQFLSQNSPFQIIKQNCGLNRFNIITLNSQTIDTLIIGHIDTVQPSKNWTKNPITAQIVDNKLFGLGSTDMKSGLASMLLAACQPNQQSNIGFLFYIDEEYDFLGAKKFIAEFKNKITPKLIISLDGFDLNITNGCRGLIEIEFTLMGLSGHAARPQNGINAITQSFGVISQLQDWLTGFIDPQLGVTSLNVAYLNGGQFQGQNQFGLILGKQGNIIADICQFIVDIRPCNNSLTAAKVIDFVRQQANTSGLSLNNTKIRFDYQSWLTPTLLLPDLGLEFNQIDQGGYLDIQLLWQAFNQIPCFTIGAGSFDQAHKANEFVRLDQLQKLQPILDKILTKC